MPVFRLVEPRLVVRRQERAPLWELRREELQQGELQRECQQEALRQVEFRLAEMRPLQVVPLLLPQEAQERRLQLVGLVLHLQLEGLVLRLLLQVPAPLLHKSAIKTRKWQFF
jgi:hypothetical protein